MAVQTEPLAKTTAAEPNVRPAPVCDQDGCVQRLTLARGDEDAVRSPAHALQVRLVSEYQEPLTKPWPAALRLAALLLGTGALWAVGGGLVGFVFR